MRINKKILERLKKPVTLRRGWLFAALTSILAEIGIEGINSDLSTEIRTIAENQRLKEYLEVKRRYPDVCLVHLYALAGAACNAEFNGLLQL